MPSRYPPIHLFERVANPDDLEAIFVLESLTNERIRDEVGDLSLVAPEDRISGAGTSPIMAAFTHVKPNGGRFTDGTYGAYYAGIDLDTAIAETVYHREQFMRATSEMPMQLDMRTYLVDLDAKLHDIRAPKWQAAMLYDPVSYAASQPFGRKLRDEGSQGIVYNSVRHAPGQCVAIFRPRLLSNCRQGAALIYVWDGVRMSEVFKKRVVWSPAVSEK